MIKVAWQVPNTKSWIGGLNYFVNLASAILSVTDRRIEPVILGSAASLPEPLCSLNTIPHPADFRKYSLHWWLSRIDRKIFNKNSLQYNSFKKHDIKIFSHGQPLGKNSPIPSLCWIPDFQHHYLSNLFNENELIKRNNVFSDLSKRAQAILLSSKNAEKDFHNFYPKSVCKTYVLRFVASPVEQGNISSEEVLSLYKINEPYFHIPNQLWVHKNHKIVLNALNILKNKGKCPLVICTGYTNDSRKPEFSDLFLEKILNANLKERFRFLGLIDFSHVSVLMRKSIALINPSYFEGWSTTVEEAKSLGKKIILSDISVHKEQAPERGIYFNPDDAETLANFMLTALKEYDPVIEEKAGFKASEDLPGRILEFGRTYENIIIDILKK